MKEKREFKTRVYWFLRLYVGLAMVRSVFIENWHGVFLCGLTLLLFMLPSIFSKSLKIELPGTLEIVILLFIFSAQMLGEYRNFYGIFRHWDTMLHTINGFLAAAIGFSLFDILNDESVGIVKMSPVLVVLVSFCFSMTIGVLWEFVEFGLDTYFEKDTQKDWLVQSFNSVSIHPEGKNIPVNVSGISSTVIHHTDLYGNPIVTIIDGGYLDIGLIDTMKDLLVNFIGAVSFSVLGYFYLRNRDRYASLEGLIPTKKA